MATTRTLICDCCGTHVQRFAARLKVDALIDDYAFEFDLCDSCAPKLVKVLVDDSSILRRLFEGS